MSRRPIRNSFALGAILATACGMMFLSAGCSDDESPPTGGDPDGGTAGTAGEGGINPDGSAGDGPLILDSSGENVGDGQCGGEAVNAEQVEVNLLVVIDRSGSMAQTPTGFTDTKWKTMIAALKTALGGIQNDMSVGLQFFPDPNVAGTDGCGVPGGSDVLIGVDVGATTVPLITAALDNAANDPDGNTPTADALELAYQYFTAGPGATLDGEKHVLLALDGGPNCNPTTTCTAAECTTNIDRSVTDPSSSACPIDPGTCCGDGSDNELNKSCLDDTNTIAKVTQLQSAGISTFVVGIPGSDLYTPVLDSLADEGGVANSTVSPKYFEVTDAQALTDTLVAITTNLITSCEFQLERVPPNIDEVNVYIDGVVVPKEGDDGWEFDTSTSPPTVVIKGQTCEDLESQGAQSVTFEFGCPTVR